ncbi:MAG: MarR family winged helix-turn-helix transcriptional regulator [Rhizomicrobium sp.]
MVRRRSDKTGSQRARGVLGSGRELSVSLVPLLENGSDRAFRQLVQDMLGVSSRLQSVRDALGEIVGLTGPQYSLLVAISHLDGIRPGVTVKRLADHLHVSGTFVTAEANKLQRAGILEKRANPDDGRSVFLVVTNAGRRLIDSLLPVLREVNDDIFRGLNRNSFQILCSQMSGMVKSLDDALLALNRHRSRRIVTEM